MFAAALRRRFPDIPLADEEALWTAEALEELLDAAEAGRR